MEKYAENTRESQSNGDSDGKCASNFEMDEQLKHLYDYTKFHIGMYMTLIIGIVGIFTNETIFTAYIEVMPWIGFSLFFFLLAGMCGGLIASSIPFYRKFEDFIKADLFPWGFDSHLLCAKTITHLEHTFFWLGTIILVVGAILEVFFERFYLTSSEIWGPLFIAGIALLFILAYKRDRKDKKRWQQETHQKHR